MTGKIDFLIIGAEKSGTTWLADMLRQHPQIFIPDEKELFYFNERFFESPELPNYNYLQSQDWFLKFFISASAGQIKGEASPAYIWDHAAPRKIFDFNRDLKLVAVLRNPIDRALSQYLYFIQRGVFSGKTFDQAVQQRKDLLTRGLYAQQLKRFYALFPSEQIYVGFYDDLRADNLAFLNHVQEYLGVPAMAPENIDEASNVTGEPRFPIINRAISWIRYPLRKYNPPVLMKLIRRTGLAKLQERIRLANTRSFDVKPRLPSDTRKYLRGYFRDDIEELQKMTGRDLSGWLRDA